MENFFLLNILLVLNSISGFKEDIFIMRSEGLLVLFGEGNFELGIFCKG